jgi:hypothetical protein
MTPDNAAYTTAAYAIAAVVYLGYVLTLKLRERRIRARLAQLDAPARSTTNRPAGA